MELTSSTFDRTVVLASADAALRQRLHHRLTGMRWKVREARGGAEAFAYLEDQPTEALLLDHWLPDLEVGEFAEQIGVMYPGVDLLRVDGDPIMGGTKSPRRNELLHALRESMNGFEPANLEHSAKGIGARAKPQESMERKHEPLNEPQPVVTPVSAGRVSRIDGLIGESAAMIELARVIRLVAPRKATVLIEGETGTGKEVVANALHRLSARSSKPFVVLNCAAIPEALLEAELFGHTRGAFTGAVQSRTGRIEAAHGGTLFLDEIGEMPLALQAKMLRFLESGELQRVGDNETLKVDVRVLAATHQPLERRANEGSFRLDLYHRLAVFPIEIPPLRERTEDLAVLCEHILTALGKTSPRKTLSAMALDKLATHDWPGNVRELAHVLERASILAEDSPSIHAEDIRLRRAVRD
ncbi:MAG: sigma-54-dependent Fis family transcriptional regulator [Acidobacteria bacterium]|nr:sigma-54-dependent Fis family transcriptional regulator [Acidobacteriota bacterium]